MRCKTNRCRTNVFEELERGLQQLVRGVPGSETFAADNPRMSVFELEDRYVVECDLPGVASETISLQLEENVLTISGRRTPVTAPEMAKVLFSERAVSEFSRKVQFARQVDQSAVDAELVSGVLRVTIPKQAEVVPQKIAIRTASQR